MHGLLFCFQYVPQEHCDFTVHSFSLVWLRNCYIAQAVMRISQNHPLCSISKKAIAPKMISHLFCNGPTT